MSLTTIFLTTRFLLTLMTDYKGIGVDEIQTVGWFSLSGRDCRVRGEVRRAGPNREVVQT
jgi:hypothetical protein